MPINTKELLDCVSMLLDEENMRVTIKETGKGTLVCATACFVGGLVGGPVGLAIGGTIGGLSAAQLTKGLLAGPIGLAIGGAVGGIGGALLTKDSFKSVSYVIQNDLTVEQREILAQKVMTAINEFHPADVAALLAVLSTDRMLQDKILKTAAGFITNEMKLQIID